MMVAGRVVAAMSWSYFSCWAARLLSTIITLSANYAASTLLHRGLSSVYTRASFISIRGPVLCLHTSLPFINTGACLLSTRALTSINTRAWLLSTRGPGFYQHADLSSINTRACPLSTRGPVFYQHAGMASINTMTIFHQYAGLSSTDTPVSPS